MSEALKPCPFCGEAVTLVEGLARHERDPVDEMESPCPMTHNTTWSAYEVAMWNRRAPDPAVQRVVEELGHISFRKIQSGQVFYEGTVSREEVQRWLSLLRGEK